MKGSPGDDSTALLLLLLPRNLRNLDSTLSPTPSSDVERKQLVFLVKDRGRTTTTKTAIPFVRILSSGDPRRGSKASVPDEPKEVVEEEVGKSKEPQSVAGSCWEEEEGRRSPRK